MEMSLLTEDEPPAPTANDAERDTRWGNQKAYKALQGDPEVEVCKKKFECCAWWRSPSFRIRISKYFFVALMDQVRSVVPIAVYLMLCQVAVFRQPFEDIGIVIGGLVAVIVGLFLFLEGLKFGLMPLGEIVGKKMPQKVNLIWVFLVAFLLGCGVTFAEPAIAALQTMGQLVSITKAPFLHAMLNSLDIYLVVMVAVGVGIATMLGILKMRQAWPLKPLMLMCLIPVLVLTAVLNVIDDLRPVIGLAWDSGAITTGPVSVPIILALGMGASSAKGSKKSSELPGFGIVTLASLVPVFMVQILGLVIWAIYDRKDILSWGTGEKTNEAWHERVPMVQLITSLRAVGPLIVFLILVMLVVVRERLPRVTFLDISIILRGDELNLEKLNHPKWKRVNLLYVMLFLVFLGLLVFNFGLEYGLQKLGVSSGGAAPTSFTDVEGVEDSPLFGYGLGLFISLLFGFILGFGATIAEPALQVMGMQVEDLSKGKFTKSMLIYTVSVGVGFGIVIGLVKITFSINLFYLLFPLYTFACILTMFSTESITNIAFDCAGVTTGAITVPLVLALGLAFAESVEAQEGFGILSMASVSPIISVLTLGLFFRGPSEKKETTKENEGTALLDGLEQSL